jgi:hypothetical protein
VTPESGVDSKLGRALELLAAAERHVALLSRCVPLNAGEERHRLAQAWQRNESVLARAPRWLLSKAPPLGDVRRALSRVAREVEGEALGALYVARADELLLEADLVEARGQPRFRELARLRYPCSPEEGERARAWAESILVSDPAGAPHLASEGEPTLKDAFEARLAALGVMANVVERDNLASAAAVGEGTVFVSRDAPRDPAQIARIVLHELEGHLLPRLRAKSEPCGLLRVAARGAGEDEEGRALLLEQRAGCWDEATAGGRARRRELALRHLAAEIVRSGGELADVMHLLLEHGLSVQAAVRLSERVLRGGGLAREVAYLPALERVSRAFSGDPLLEKWFERGRVSVEAARLLEAQSKSTTTGT